MIANWLKIETQESKSETRAPVVPASLFGPSGSTDMDHFSRPDGG